MNSGFCKWQNEHLEIRTPNKKHELNSKEIKAQLKSVRTHAIIPMVAILRSKTGEAVLIWALRLTGDRRSTPRHHRGAEQRTNWIADEKLSDRKLPLDGGAHLAKVREGGAREWAGLEERVVEAKRTLQALEMEDDDADGEA